MTGITLHKFIALFAATAAACLLALAAAPPAHAANCKGADKAPDQLSKKKAEKSLLCLINNERKSRGLGKVKTQKAQKKAAKKHSKLMVKKGCFAHQCKGEHDLTKRLEASNYLGCNCYWGVGENIAYGENSLASPRSLMKAWMNSPAHKDNITNRNFEHIGVGIVWGTPDAGKRRSAMTVTTTFGYID